MIISGSIKGASGRRFGLVAAPCAVLLLAAGSPVHAQSIGVAADVESSIGTRGGVETFSGTNLEAYRAGTPVDGGGFEAIIDEQPGSIFFRNGTISLGAIGVIASSTRLDILLTNDTAAPLAFQSFESVIIPAGFGFYTTAVTGGCSPLTPTGCGSALGPSADFANLVRPAAAGPGELLGRVGFTFEVLVDGVVQFELASSLGIEFDPVLGTNRLVEAFGDGPSVLSGWRLDSPPGDPSIIGYAWDATNFSVTLDRFLAPGETQTVTYLSSVFAESYSISTFGFNDLALLGYSAFGDPPPIGRPGGGGSLSTFSFAAGHLAGAVDGLEIGGFTFVYPFWSNGKLFFPPAGGVVPEPSTWAMLMAGFGLVGAVSRRRRVATA